MNQSVLDACEHRMCEWKSTPYAIAPTTEASCVECGRLLTQFWSSDGHELAAKIAALGGKAVPWDPKNPYPPSKP